MSEGTRLDRWLWAARFFKTRGLAVEAIDGGKIHLNGRRPKRSREIKVGDLVRVQKGPFEHRVVVKALSTRRGPAAEAAKLYEETPESIADRELVRDHLRTAPVHNFQFKGRPTKKERRDLDRLKGD